MSHIWPALIGALALAVPSAPAQSASPAILVPICGGGVTSIPMGGPINGAPMDHQHDCCKGACHAGCERRNLRRIART